MPGHGAAAEIGFGSEIGVAIELGEKFLQAQEAQSKHERLIAIISGPEIAFAKGVGKSDLGDFLAFAENAELGFSCKNFLPADRYWSGGCEKQCGSLPG